MKNTYVQPIDQPTHTAYIVKEYGGKLAVFNQGVNRPLAVYEV